jgi:hypothetical protein
MTPRTCSLGGCRTSDAALVRLGTWLEQIHLDQLRQFETDVLACECADVDVDELDAVLAEQRTILARYRNVLLQGTHALFVEHGLA